MKFNKSHIFLISLISIFLLLSLSAVSASDNMDNQLSDSSSDLLIDDVNEIADAIQHSFDRKLEYFDFSRLKEGKSYLNVMLKRYIDNVVERIGDTEVRRYKWKFIDNLASCGILLF